MNCLQLIVFVILFWLVWVGTHESDVALMSTIIEAFAEQTNRLFQDGVYVGDTLYKFLPFAYIVDSVARPIIQNMLRYNGYYGCILEEL